ncbi:hypothetical protein COCNU_11G003960 [Cocos nucifera]|uniref:Uncharacterized protein n=1 Tax=Cocos nucifera TaxID=13894 RepID=A0A8K0IQ73_COCNU|nr:hypothetical protein COCNU_11G003960 [Cocos nucifera]
MVDVNLDVRAFEDMADEVLHLEDAGARVHGGVGGTSAIEEALLLTIGHHSGGLLHGFIIMEDVDAVLLYDGDHVVVIANEVSLSLEIVGVRCDDKWDNLFHDSKKVRNYKARTMASTIDSSIGVRPSYWAMERHDWNSKCKSMRKGSSKGGMAKMGDIGSDRKGVE